MMLGGQHKRVWVILLLSIAHIMSRAAAAAAAGRPFPHEPQGQVTNYFRVEWEARKEVRKEEGRGEGMVHEDGLKVASPLGSRPPSCDHKCGGCEPCAAIQVPTTTDHFRTQFTNYEPEGWKCKCGSSLFNP